MASHDAGDYRTGMKLSSPLHAADFAGDARIGMVMYDDQCGDEPDAVPALVWSESVSGRTTLRVRNNPDDAPRCLTPDHSVRGGIGYGGGEFTIARGWAYFVSGERLWKVGVRESLCRNSANRCPQPLTPAQFSSEDANDSDGVDGILAGNAVRGGAWAAPVVSPDGRWLVAIHEDARERTRLVTVDTDGKFPPRVLYEAEGFDFLMQPRFAPDGMRLVWVGWRDGEMPWDAARLFTASWTETDGSVSLRDVIKNVPDGCSKFPCAVLQPEFLSDGRLVYISDGNEKGFGRVVTESATDGVPLPDGVELFQPAWIQETRVMAPLADGTLVVIADRAGVQSIDRLNPATGEMVPIGGFLDEQSGGGEYGEFATLAASPDGERIAVVAGGPRTPVRLLEWATHRIPYPDGCFREVMENTTPDGHRSVVAERVRTVVRTSSEPFMPRDLVPMYPIVWPGDDGWTIHGMLWNSRIMKENGGNTDTDENSALSPLLVMVHGGPTGHVRAGWNVVAQHFATRGWAVFSVNHRGSTGFGRAYRDALHSGWGMVELADIVSGIRHLAGHGFIDRRRVAILGGSAGGFTVLNAILHHPDLFAAGIALYPVVDLVPTHAAHTDSTNDAAPEPKFERRYFEWLIGTYPESVAVYNERSPLRCGLPFRRPVALFHGREDRIVPSAHSESIAARLADIGVPYVFHLYDGESHGFRRRETLDHCYREIDRFLVEHVTQ